MKRSVLLIAVLLTACSESSESASVAAPVEDRSVDCVSIPTGDLRLLSPYATISPEVSDLWSSSGQLGDVPGSYLLYVPSNLPPGPRPLVVSLHGGVGNGALHAQQSQFAEAAERHGFIVAFPTQGGRAWDYHEKGAGVRFIRDVVADIRVNHACVDSRRIYANGHSMGGLMVQRLACDAGDVFAAVASHAGGGDVSGYAGLVCEAGQTGQPEGYESVAIRFMHGDKDSVVSYAVGKRSKDNWIRRYDCDSVATEQQVAFGALTTYMNCRSSNSESSGRELVQWRQLYGHDHGWPNGCGGGSAGVTSCPPGDAPSHISAAAANDEIWAFLSVHPRAQPAAAQSLALAQSPDIPVLDEYASETYNVAGSAADTMPGLRRVDEHGATLVAEDPISDKVRDLTIHMALDVTTRFNAVVGPYHPVCPTESDTAPSAQFVSGKSITVRVSADDWHDEANAVTQILENPRRAVATAHFRNLPQGIERAARALRVYYDGDPVRTWHSCGIPPVWYKETFPAKKGGKYKEVLLPK